MAEDGMSPLKKALGTIDRLQARIEHLEAAARAPVAIVGMGCRFPGGASDPAAYWSLLAAGEAGIAPVPPQRWDADALYDPDPHTPGRLPLREGGFLGDVSGFDAAFFDIPADEAASLDPQQRLALEVAWETCEDAGIPPARLARTATGVFLGAAASDWRERAHRDPAALDAFSGTGTSLSVAAGRLAHLWDLQGPAMVVDTACSASLVAVHQAVRALRAGDCDRALAGGVHLLLAPEGLMATARMGLFSPSGRCRPFDAGADGIGIGEGCGLVFLKRLQDAVADGDRVHAVIRGTAVNHDGRSNGLTAPNGPSQVAVIERALADAGLSADAVDCVEAHGTGTPLGDPIEMEALAGTYGRTDGDAAPCLVGAAKANLGHLASAAGIASLIKAVLALRHEQVPPTPGFETLNPEISLAGTRLAVAAPDLDPGALAWTGSERHAAVSSFGWSGTNAHMIVAAPEAVDAGAARTDEAAADATTPDAPWVLPISARSPGALRTLAERYRAWLAAAGRQHPLPAIGAALVHGRQALDHRLAVWGTTHEAVLAVLDHWLAGEDRGPMPALAERFEAGAPVDWSTVYPHRVVLDLPTMAWERRRFWAVPDHDAVHAADDTEAGALEARLRGLPPAERRPALEREIRGMVADLLGLDGPDAVPADGGFFELGMSSLGALNLHRRMEKLLAVSVPRTIAFEKFTVAAVTDFLADGPLADLMDESPAGGDAARDPAAGATGEDVAEALEGLLDSLDAHKERP